ncbi:polysaccharide deacetylase [Paenibacillus guangzhouensis]|uniref:polysaccharide deacetylase n=1 Tax=Paenibacillus guangzhouensis TaxID=1473112 RepID=UPI00187B4F0C|nr:polysaccharide deacetylase [Paenibacillus guangzhouensis]
MKNQRSNRQHVSKSMTWNRRSCAMVLLLLFNYTLFTGIASAEQSAKVLQTKTVYLTFDDGPSKNTSEVLDILAKEKIKATFFVLGQQAAEHPDLVKRIVQEGHQLGNHSYNHAYKPLYTDFREFWRQVIKTEDVLNQIVGQRPTLLRAPGGTYGNFDQNYFDYLGQAGFIVHDWDVDSGDSKRRNVPASEIIKGVKSGPLKTNVTVLLHDGTGHSESVKALPTIIQYYKNNGYQFAALTPEVKPVQFRLASKSKWVKAALSSEEADRMMMQSVNSWPEASSGTVMNRSLPLQIRNGSSTWLLNVEEYQMIRDQFYVSLRTMTSRMGGEITWHETEQTVMIKIGDLQADMNMSKRVAVVKRSDGERTDISLDYVMSNGSIQLNLRDLLEVLNLKVVGYVDDGQKREVTVE